MAIKRGTAHTDQLQSAQASGPFTVNGWSAEQQQVGGQLMAILQQGGLSKAGAAGVLGNLMQESSLNPGEPGGYLAQWGGSRLTALASFANSIGKPVTSVEAQGRFIVHELQTGYPSLYKSLSTANDPGAAAIAISNLYERPATWAANLPNRVAQARAVYGGTGQGEAPAGSSGGSGSPSLSSVLTAPLTDVASMLASVAVNMIKYVAIGIGDTIIVPFWHWNQRAVSAYQKNMFSDSTGVQLLWTATFWGGGYWLLFTDPNAKGLRPATVRNSRLARHARLAQSLPARASLVKPKDVGSRTPTKPKPVISTAAIEPRGTMSTTRPNTVKVTGTHVRTNGGDPAQSSIPVERASRNRNGATARDTKAARTKARGPGTKSNASNRTRSRPLPDRRRDSQSGAPTRSNGRNRP